MKTPKKAKKFDWRTREGKRNLLLMRLSSALRRVEEATAEARKILREQEDLAKPKKTIKSMAT